MSFHTSASSLPADASARASAGFGSPRTGSSLLSRLGLTISLGLALAACGESLDVDHGQGGAFTPLGFDQAVVGESGAPKYLSGRMPASIQRSEDAAEILLSRLGTSYRLAPGTTLAVESQRTDENGLRFVRLGQQHGGLRVVGKQVVVQIGTDGALEAVLGSLAADLPALPAIPYLDGETAIARGLERLSSGTSTVYSAPEKVVYLSDAGQPVVAYQARVEYHGSKGRAFEDLFVDARDGAVLSEHPLIFTALAREIYDLKMVCLKDGSELPGTKLMDEGGMTTDMAGMRAYTNSGNVYWFYKHMWNRDSYDGKGALVKSSVHGTFDTGMGCSGENAAWIPDPFNQMVYGDGTIFGIILKDLTLGFDVAAHEMTHAVTFSTSMLDYMNEPGALNEAMSDIIGSGAEAWSKSGGSVAGNPMGGIKVDANTWKIGEEVAGFLLPGGALRFMNNPTADMVSKDYYPERETGTFDNGGVHINSGIANLAAYLMSQGGSHPRMKTTTTVAGFGFEKTIRIFHYANANLLTSTSNFEAARYATAHAAEILYGRCGATWANVHRAWDAVGVPGTWSVCSRPPKL